MIGIYIITNEVNGKCYVGQVGKGKNKTFEKRFNEHYSTLRNNKHYNKHLQASWNKYGEENFTFDILEEVEDVNLLDDKEKYWITYYDSFKNGYNNTDGGEGTIGYKWTEEQKQKQSEIMRDVTNRPEYKQKMSEAKKGENNPMYGKKHSEETKQKMRKPKSEETKQKMRKPKSEETKQKMSEALKGENNPRYIPITDEMINDYKNGIRFKDFCSKYNVSQVIWDKVRKQIKAD